MTRDERSQSGEFFDECVCFDTDLLCYLGNGLSFGVYFVKTEEKKGV